MKKSISIIVLLITMMIKTHAISLSIKEAYDIALLNNDSLKSASIGVQKANKLSQATKMIYLPQIDIMANYDYINNPVKLNIPLLNPINLSTNNIVFGILNITYPIFTGGKRIYANKIADLNIIDSNYTLNMKELNLFEELVKSYYGLLLNIEILQALINAENNNKEHLENAIKLEEQGQIARIEKLEIQVEYDKSKSKVINARNSLDLALLAFKNTLQDSNINNDVKINNNYIENLELKSKLEISNKELESLDSIKDKVISSYPMLKSIENKKEQAKELTKMEMANFMPTIAAYGGYVMKDNNVVINKMIPEWYVGVTAKWSLLNPSGRIFKYQASKLAQNEIEYSLSQARKDILLLTEQTYKEAISTKNAIENLNSSLELAKENLKLQEESFANGLSNISKVNDARNILLGATIEIKNAQYRYILALSRLCVLSNDINMFYSYW